MGLSAADNPLQLDSPTVLAVGPLLRELIIAYTGSDADPPERARLRAVLLDQLLISPQQPLHVPTPPLRCFARSATSCSPTPPTAGPSPNSAAQSARAIAVCLASFVRTSVLRSRSGAPRYVCTARWFYWPNEHR